MTGSRRERIERYYAKYHRVWSNMQVNRAAFQLVTESAKHYRIQLDMLRTHFTDDTRDPSVWLDIETKHQELKTRADQLSEAYVKLVRREQKLHQAILNEFASRGPYVLHFLVQLVKHGFTSDCIELY